MAMNSKLSGKTARGLEAGEHDSGSILGLALGAYHGEHLSIQRAERRRADQRHRLGADQMAIAPNLSADQQARQIAGAPIGLATRKQRTGPNLEQRAQQLFGMR